MVCAPGAILSGFEWIQSRVRRGLTVLAASLLLTSPLHAQSSVLLDTNLPLFTVLSALHTAGYRASASRPVVHPALARIFEELQQVRGPATDALSEFFAAHRRMEPAADLSRYVSFALVVAGPPGFDFRQARIQLPPDVLELEGLNERLRDFYAEAKLEKLWQAYRPQCEGEIARLQPHIAQTLLVSEAYLRLPPPTFAGRQYRIYFDLLLDPNLTFARNYADDYYLVLSPLADAPLDAIRHAYLHFLLDPIAGKFASAINTKKELYPVALRAELLPDDFRNDFVLFTTECLIKATEIRMDKPAVARAAESLDAAEKQGFVMVRYFYDALAAFEQAEPSIKLYFPELVQPIDVASELRRLGTVEFAKRRPPALTAQSTTMEAMLRDADNALAVADAVNARRLYQAVLDRYGPEQPRALYGLALAAGLERDWALAKRYFLQTLERTRDPHLVAWSHVYLGRIYDVEGNRVLALGEYQAALQAGTPSAEVQQAARRGLEKPFGPERPAPENEKKENE